MTTPPTTLHDILHAELERRLAVANSATEAPSEVFSVSWPRTAGKDALIAYYALHDPADAIRRYLGEIEVLERHKPNEDHDCHTCLYDTLQTYQDMPIANREDWPCPEIRSLAGRLGVSVDG